jgi:hypothetical protein
VALMTAVGVGAPATVVAALGPSDGARAAAEADKKPKKAKKKAKAKADAASTAKGMPADACALLTTAEVGALVPNANPGEPADQSAGGYTQLGCSWENEPTASTTASSVSVLLTEVKARDRALAEATIERGDGEAISGLGDAAAVTTMGLGSTVQVLVGDVLMTLDYSAVGGGGREAEVIALARAAAGRM